MLAERSITSANAGGPVSRSAIAHWASMMSTSAMAVIRSTAKSAR
jgi:hypothetical protein